MELIKKLPNEIQSEIFLYYSYVPFNKNDLNRYTKIFKPIYFKSNYDLIYISKNQCDAVSNEL